MNNIREENNLVSPQLKYGDSGTGGSLLQKVRQLTRKHHLGRINRFNWQEL